ncbi:MAG TPA: antibiotic biosynthesis monooxygenase [Steroidobacteraceae bacterium]
MFNVFAYLHPKPSQFDAYLANAKKLRPELEQVDGWVQSMRYRSLVREGWVLSLSEWRDEKALVRWRVNESHHQVQEKGRSEILLEYQIRAGQVTHDTNIPQGHSLQEQRLDETEAGAGTTVTLIDVAKPPSWTQIPDAAECARYLGLQTTANGLVNWDVFDAILLSDSDTPRVILLMSWRSHADAEAFERSASPPPGARVRRIRVVRDYGMFDRREAPQYYPPVQPTEQA